MNANLYKLPLTANIYHKPSLYGKHFRSPVKSITIIYILYFPNPGAYGGGGGGGFGCSNIPFSTVFVCLFLFSDIFCSLACKRGRCVR